MNVQSIRDRLFHEQKGRCFYCRCHMVAAGADDDRAATFEHRVPRALGGGTHYANGVCSCRKCNKLKGDMLEPAFVKLVLAKRVRVARKAIARRAADFEVASQRAARKMRERRQLGGMR